MENELCSELRGVKVISIKEGAELGRVENVYLDKEENKLKQITFKKNMFGTSGCVDVENIDLIGDDVIFVNSKENTFEIKGNLNAEGVSLKKLKGKWITTDDGRHLGQFIDANYDRANHRLTEVYLSKGYALPINGDRMTIGPDEIMVSASGADKIRKSTKANKGNIGAFFREKMPSKFAAQLEKVTNEIHGTPNSVLKSKSGGPKIVGSVDSAENTGKH